MIIECERCHTKFNLDKGLLKENGSKVKCSICKYTFTAYPPKEEEVKELSIEEIEGAEVITKGETPQEKDVISNLDKTLVTEALEGTGQIEEEELEAISFEDISRLDSGLPDEHEKEEIEADIDKVLDEAGKAEKKILAQDEEEKEPAKPQPVIKKRHRSALWIILLFIILLLGGTAAALYVFEPDLFFEYFPSLKKAPPKEEVFDMGNKRLSIKRDPDDLRGFFVASNKAGKLFVVKGFITNNYPDKRSFIRVRSNILDSKGKVVKSKITYAGNLMSDKELESLSMVEINDRLLNKFGKDKVNTNIPPNASIPFMIIFSDLPQDISEFTVEPISSLPAKK